MPSLPKSPVRSPLARARAASARPPEPEEPRVEIIETPGLRWINIERPRQVDQAWLEERFEFHPLDYEDVFSRNQRPKVDEYDDYLFIVLHFPRYDKTVSRLNAAELDLFIGPDYLITLPNEPLQPVEYLFERCRTNEELRELAVLQGRRLPALQDRRRLRRRLVPDAAQDGQQARAHRGGDLRGRARPRSCATSPTSSRRSSTSARSIRPQRAALRDLERTKQRYIADDLDIYFDDIVDASERIWDMLENYKEVVEALESTNESAISHRVNEILQLLTVFSVLLLPLTLDGLDLRHERARPGEQDITAFWIVIAAMVLLLGGMLVLLPPPALDLMSARGDCHRVRADRRRRGARARARRPSGCWSSSTRTRRRCRTG